MIKFSHILTAVLLMVSALFAVVRPSFISLIKPTSKEDLLVKEYLVLRNTIINNQEKMALRWGGNVGVCYRSSDSVCAEFANYALQELDLIAENRIEREIEFLSFERKQTGIWEADFLTKDKVKSGEEVITRRWKTVIYASKNLNKADAKEKKAPLLVTHYAQEERPLRKLPVKMVDIKELVSRYISINYSTFGSIEDTVLFWGERSPLRQMSSFDNYQKISEGLAQEVARLNLQFLERAVIVEDAFEIMPLNWQVEFKSFDYFPDVDEPKIREWTAFLKIAFREDDVLFNGIEKPLSGISTFFEGFANPSGFMVEHQTLFTRHNNKEVFYIDAPDKEVFENKKQMIIGYLKTRKTITKNTEQMQNEWGFFGKIRELSSEKSFVDFYSKAIVLYDFFSKNEMTRTFEILSLKSLGAKIDIIGGEEWQATFLTKDFDDKNNLIEERVWKATFRTSVISVRSNEQFAKMMPHRFLVHNYESSSNQLFPYKEKTKEQAFIETYILETIKQKDYQKMLFENGDINNYNVIVINVNNIIDNLFEAELIIKDKNSQNQQTNIGNLWRAEINLLDKKDFFKNNFNVEFFNLNPN